MAMSWTIKDQREYALEYFKVHAQQRMSLFNFFVVFSSLVVTGIASTFQERIQAHLVGGGLGLLLILISYVFWKLDNRVGFLIKHAEAALKWIEANFPFEKGENNAQVLQLYMLEETLTENKRRNLWYAPWRWHLTYSRCFGLTFLAFGLIGFVGSTVSFILWVAKMKGAC